MSNYLGQKVMLAEHSFLNMKSHHWNRILSEIESGKLLPIIGSELLKIEINGSETTFYEYIANEVSESLGLKKEHDLAPNSLAEVVYLYRQNHGDPKDIYYEAQEIINSEEWPIPEALAKLAEITDFDLFVSVTPDNLMTKALNEVRCKGETNTNVISYYPNMILEDLPDAYGIEQKVQPTVFKLFGDLDMKPNYAITEEDVLKVMHHLQIRDKRPANLFDILRQRSLALIGCSFENWLNRFFFCSTKTDALFGSFGARGVIADKFTKNDNLLLPFLTRNHTLLFQTVML